MCSYETITKLYSVIPSYTNRPNKPPSTHVIAHSQHWGAPRLQVADMLVLQFLALDSPGTAGTIRHAENQSSQILHCIVLSYTHAYTSYLHDGMHIHAYTNVQVLGRSSMNSSPNMSIVFQPDKDQWRSSCGMVCKAYCKRTPSDGKLFGLQSFATN